VKNTFAATFSDLPDDLNINETVLDVVVPTDVC